MPTKVLGLFVVGTLARRWDIDVTLARTPGGGVTAEVTIPATLLLRHERAGLRRFGGRTTRGPTRRSRPPGPSTPGREQRRPAPSWAASDSGPRPSITLSRPEPAVPEQVRAEDEPAPLPRRVSRYETVTAAAAAPPPLTHHAPADESAALDTAPGGSRPLRRRVKGATLRTGAEDAAQQAARQAPRPADADAVRSALEEFEAAVEQANRDSDTLSGLRLTDANHPHDRNNLPKGAEQ